MRKAAIIILLLLLFNTLQIGSVHNTKKYGDLDFYEPAAHFAIFLYGLTSLFCTLASWRILRKLNFSLPVKFVMVFFMALVLFGVFSSLLFVLSRAYYGYGTPWSWLPNNFLFASTIAHFHVTGATIAYLYFRESRKLKDALEKVDTEKKLLRAQLLQKNLEPHFLFNNLSVLSSLLREDKDSADRFMDNLSDVYRYFLRHNESDKVPLKEELAFVENYILLIKMRFDGAYSISLDIDDESGFVVPFALHTCIENALKHNAASQDEPLFVIISRQGATLMVRNSLKPIESTTSHKIGLSNIAERYALISGNEIKITENVEHFTVELPIF